MIIGIGNDIVDIRRIERTISRHPLRFLKRCYSPAEQEEYNKRQEEKRVSFLAKNFAAKEACVKALGTGFINDIFLRDISVERDKAGKPVLILHGGALKKLQEISHDRGEPILHVSLSDEPPYASAFVVLETR